MTASWYLEKGRPHFPVRITLLPLWKRMPCDSSTSSFRPRIHDSPTVRPTPMDERDWLPTRVVNGFDDEVMCVHYNNSDTYQMFIILLDETKLRSDWHTLPPDAADGDPEATRTTPNSASRRHVRLDAHGLHLLPHSRFLPFRWCPRRTISNPRSPSHSHVLPPLSSSSPLLHAHNRSRTSRRRSLSSSTISMSIAPTITPARYATAQVLARGTPPHPPRGPKLFFTSAKTGVGVLDVFAYITHGVSSRAGNGRKGGDQNGARKSSMVGLDQAMIGQKRTFRSACCSS
jgi:hypothetical protein